MKLPTEFYIIFIQDDGGQAGNETPNFFTPSMNTAYKWFVDAISNQQYARVFKTELDVETNAFEIGSEITDRFAATIQGKEAA